MQFMNATAHNRRLAFVLLRSTRKHGAFRKAPRIASIIAALLTASCATQAPVEEVQLFNRAFANVQEASQPLFDDLGAAEREHGQRDALNQAKEESPTG